MLDNYNIQSTKATPPLLPPFFLGPGFRPRVDPVVPGLRRLPRVL